MIFGRSWPAWVREAASGEWVGQPWGGRHRAGTAVRELPGRAALVRRRATGRGARWNPEEHAGLRVALLLGSSTGGIGRHVASLAAGLVRLGHGVTVYGPVATQEHFSFTEAGARFTPLEIPASPRPGDVRAVTALRRALRADPADVMHAHGLRAGLVAALAPPWRPLHLWS